MFIKLQNVNLNFPIYDNQNDNMRNYLLKSISKNIDVNVNSKQISTLKNINLEIKSGDRVALYGKNGSGKTSLLKVMSGIYKTNGNVVVEGKIFPLLTVDTGLNLDATGYENIFLILFTKNLDVFEIKKKIDWVINFSGLEEKIFLPVRTYSAGMKLRLVTSIALCQENEIFLVDEFFAAGDKEFQKKTSSRMMEIVERSGIFVFATHSESHIKNLCNKILYLKNGTIEYFGQTKNFDFTQQ
jgi:ABC-type polysaccharide/polyol phosphate transport system ATPase subunit